MSFNLKNNELHKYTKEELILIIREYCSEQLDLARRKMLDEENFSKAGWSEHQAHQLGFQKAYTKLLTFIPDPEGQ